MKKKLTTHAWAWKIKNDKGRWVLCHWAEGHDDMILAGPPSPEAKLVRVKLTEV
jgi:hypothetical protein